MVFYRKYRPQNFEELIGQDHVKKTLLSAFETGKLAHAYLFCGPRGSGKTSTARILAKLVNCESDQAIKLSSNQEKAQSLSSSIAKNSDFPCNKCSACLSITDGSNMDLIEIDAASNRGIDDIRDLREKIKLSPSSLKKKVYIIDEVHMLTTEAFNALLKTLEEPPAHVLFILATTEVGKLPATILSRVQRFDFKLATLEQIRLALKNICDKENLKLSEEILTLIAQSSEGSFRDAVKLLDHVASAGEVSLEQVQGLLKANDFSETTGFIEKIISQDSKGALMMIQQLNEKGTNIKEFTNSILKALRQLLLIDNGAGELVKAEAGSGRFEILKSFSGKIDQNKLILYLENFQKSLEQLKYTTISSLPLEVAAIKSVARESKGSYESKESDVKKPLTPLTQAKVLDSSDSLTKPQPDPIPSVETMTSTDDVVIITDKWTYILETIRPYNYSLEALLKQAKIKNCDGVNVVLEVPYSFHQRILEAPKSRTLLESILADVLGKSIKVTTVLGKREVKASELANVEVAQDDEIVRLASEIFNS
ncbi:MAG TPA: DNA polymerase III subunit gamma/tau [Patescibacteria group bacterium]|nr:DNA polymerase III subunit gamma/tau [Patescibacteria group bacterium]